MRKKRKQSGMTLIEILVVLVIMSGIASAVAFGVMKQLEVARRHDTETRARTIQSAAVAYLMETPSKCPTVDDLVKNDTLDKTTKPVDGWDQPFLIECDGTTVHVKSRGKDGQLGTEDDLGF